MIKFGIAFTIISYGAVLYGVWRSDEQLVSAGIHTFVIAAIVTVILMLADHL